MDYKELICAVIGCIEQNIKGKPNYSELEKAVGFTYHHIREIFQRVTQITLSRYILSRKVANAAFEIRHSDKSITEIALDYEFANPETLTRAFRRDTGLTPSRFKKSGYLCGRRIICPGVYAPVILDLENPRFTLPKLREVNEMGEMKKTNDSCILYGVPKVHFGREVDGQAQATPFPMCLQAVLNYMGQNISYAELMAYSGAAFRQRWDSNGWNIAAVDIRFTYGHHLEPFERAFKGAGRKFVISESPDMPKNITKGDAIELIKSELDCGRPVIALGVVGPPEACIVTGYRNDGETLLGWSLFQDFWGGCEIDESGYFIKGNWWDETEAIMSIGEEIGNRTPDREILENALMLMATHEMPTYGGNDIFYGGQAAYEAWAEAVEDDAAFADGVDLNKDEIGGCLGDAETMLGEGRGFAAAYMCMLAEKYPELSADIKKCAKSLGAASECADKMIEIKGGCGLGDEAKFRDKEVRKKIAAIIRRAAEHEADACAVLKEIIGKMYLNAGEVWLPPTQNQGRKYDINLRALIPAVNHTQGISLINAEGNYRGKGTQKHWFEDGSLVVTSDWDMECLQTITGFKIPLRIDATVKTCSGDIRLYYLMGEIIFNLHGDAEFHDHDIITGEWKGYNDKAPIPPEKFVNIVWIIEKEFMEVYVDGELYHRRDNMPYMRILKKAPAVSKLIAPIRISAANDSTITIKSLSVTKL